MSTGAAEARVELTIPARAEYVGVARLAILGVASRMRFSYDEVEDIRLAVGEACANAIERVRNGQPAGRDLRVRCFVMPQSLVVEVIDPAPYRPGEAPVADAGPLDEAQLGSVLIRILMDEVAADNSLEDGTHTLRMVKHVAR